jgi:hypothetical protein
MRTYSYEDYGLVLSKKTMELLCKGMFRGETIPEDEYAMALCDAEVCTCAPNFTGEAFKIKDDGTNDWDSAEVYDDCVYYVSIRKYPNLFSTAYTDMNEMIAEFKTEFSEYLPDDFDYRSNICHIVGTIFC